MPGFATLVGRARAKGAKKVAAVTSTSTRTRGGTGDPNVRRNEAANPLTTTRTPELPGKNARGVAAVEPAFVCIYSRVDLLVKTYVDGTVAGTVAPWVDWCGHCSSGDRRLYARATAATRGLIASASCCAMNTGARRAFSAAMFCLEKSLTWGTVSFAVPAVIIWRLERRVFAARPAPPWALR